MKIFGIGLNKTGTTSLGKALEVLGFKNHVSCRLDLTKEWAVGNLSPILEIARYNDNFEDWPWPLVYQEVFSTFPDAKFILTKRQSEEAWFESLCRHALATGPTEYRKLIYGSYMPHDFKEEHIAFYQKHNQTVIDFFKENAPDKLLVMSFENGDSWNELCAFLKIEEPKCRFPYLNQSNNYKEQVQVSNKIAVRFIKSVRLIKKYFHS